MSNRAIYWEQGMFLQPQHFQVMRHNITYGRMKANSFFNPYMWGISALDVNAEALVSDFFEIRRIEFLLKEGEFVSFPDNATLAPRSYKDAWTNPELPLNVYVALAPERHGGSNVYETDSPEDAPDWCRYTTPLEAEHVVDMHGKGAVADVRTLYFRLRICFNDEGKNEFIRIPVACLKRDGERVLLDPRFVPPVVDFNAAPALRYMVRDIRDTLLSRTRQLEEFKIVDGDIRNSEAASSHGIMLFCVLGALSRNIPELEQMLLVPRVHPWLVFVALSRLVGELSVFASSLSPIGETAQGEKALPEYDHQKLFDCYQGAMEIILRLADSLVAGPAYTFRMEPAGDFLGTVMPQTARSNTYSYWLLFRSVEKDRVAEQVASMGKLAPTQDIASLVKRSLPGIRLIGADSPPAGLPRRRDTAYFMIDQSDILWRTVLNNGELALSLPNPPEDLLVQLTVVQR